MQQAVRILTFRCRGISLLVLTAALVISLLPTAAFAASADNDVAYTASAQYERRGMQNQRPTYRYPARKGGHVYQHHTYRQTPRYDYNHRYEGHHNDYDHDYGHMNDGYDKHSPKKYHCANTYHVRRGDTLSKIAKHYHTTVYGLAKANNIRNVNRIYAGQTLCIK